MNEQVNEWVNQWINARYPTKSYYLLDALSCLSWDLDQLDNVEFFLHDVQMSVQAGPFTPLRDDGKVRFGHTTHE